MVKKYKQLLAPEEFSTVLEKFNSNKIYPSKVAMMRNIALSLDKLFVQMMEAEVKRRQRFK